ncbi:hypothetical protein ACHAW6_007359 [Cyclotella cf. meneghiniana]
MNTSVYSWSLLFPMIILSSLLNSNERCQGFVPPKSATVSKIPFRRTSALDATMGQTRNRKGEDESPGSRSGGGSNKRSSGKRYQTIGDLVKEIEKNPSKFITSKEGQTKKKSYKRTRQKVERPKQKYLYASQRKALELLAKRRKSQTPDSSTESLVGPNVDLNTENDSTEGEAVIDATTVKAQQMFVLQQEMQQRQMELARSLGLSNPATQVADAVVGDGREEVPRIVGSIRLDEDEGTVTSNSFAYVVYKPGGWSILGGGERKKKGLKNDDDIVENQCSSPTKADSVPSNYNNKPSGSKMKRVKAYDEESDEFTYVEYNEADILAVLTPEERAELMKEGGLNLRDDAADVARGSLSGAEWDAAEDDHDVNEDDGSKKKKKRSIERSVPRLKANIVDLTSSRPSLVSWLKQLKADEGTPIKGGKNWVAIAGATEVDDSGLLLLCPRDRVEALHVDRCGYVAVVGNGKKMVSRSRLIKSIKSSIGTIGGELYDDSTATIEVISRLRKGRDQDPVSTVEISLSDGASSCSHAVLMCQDRLGDGIRGDVLADPLDRRAARRLVHCESMVVSSLVNLDVEPVVVTAGPSLPDDVAIYASRRDGAIFIKGSYLGRQSGLAQNGLTTAYREINGAADGYPGWIVDRYDKWLFVQQEEGPMSVRGPLPSLHDGNTTGVYILSTKADRSVMGTEQTKPHLLEGQAAPEYIPVKENGITYLVTLGESFSTGIFLDQRLQRAWLAQHCTKDTRVLNCFAHTGAYSIAAATAGASTVSLDLDKKWLDRIRPQMEANGIFEWEGKHDCIYGDCFDWLARLAKRNEQFDIVILDPPSTSVNKFRGAGKKRWSVKSDMDELVALAASLVKREGLLMTTTNAASLRPEKFAKMCQKGLMDAGVSNAKLERISPMPSDFPSIGCQPVTNLIWRIP